MMLSVSKNILNSLVCWLMNGKNMEGSVCGIILEGLRKSMKKLNQHIWCARWYSNQVPQQDESGVLPVHCPFQSFC